MPSAVLILDLELVQGALVEALDEQTPDAGTGDEFHIVAGPVVEGSGHKDPTGIGRPDGEADARDRTALVILYGDDLRAEALPDLGVPTVVEPFEIPSGQAAELVVCHGVLLVSCVALQLYPSTASRTRFRAAFRLVATIGRIEFVISCR